MKPPKKLIKSENIRLRECVLTFDGAHTPKSGLSKTKICTKCGEVKVLDKYYKNKGRKDGLVGICKTCLYAQEKEYRAKNPEKFRTKHRKYYIANREYLREYNRERARKFRIENPNIVKNYQKNYQNNYCSILKNKRKAVKRTTKWVVENREKVRIYQKKKSHDNVTNLKESYVKSRLCRDTNLVSADMPQELIVAKREYIKLGRLLKGIENEDNEGSQRKTG